MQKFKLKKATWFGPPGYYPVSATTRDGSPSNTSSRLRSSSMVPCSASPHPRLLLSGDQKQPKVARGPTLMFSTHVLSHSVFLFVCRLLSWQNNNKTDKTQ